jgi:hypothetical protein
MSIIGKIVVAPLRAVNIAVKTAKAVIDFSMAEDVTFENNALDALADGIEKEVGKITGEKEQE